MTTKRDEWRKKIGGLAQREAEAYGEFRRGMTARPGLMIRDFRLGFERGYAMGYDACAAEKDALNELDPTSMFNEACKERDEYKAKLAEKDAELHKMGEELGIAQGHLDLACEERDYWRELFGKQLETTRDLQQALAEHLRRCVGYEDDKEKLREALKGESNA